MIVCVSVCMGGRRGPIGGIGAREMGGKLLLTQAGDESKRRVELSHVPFCVCMEMCS